MEKKFSEKHRKDGIIKEKDTVRKGYTKKL